jgi:hypothetical protein
MERVDYQPLVIQDLINIHARGELDVNPWYQRRSVWTVQQKGYLINTIFVGKPVPSLYIRHYLDVEQEKSIKEVVDGQQRVRSVLEYAASEYGARHPNHTGKVKFAELSKRERESFKMTSLSTGVLVGASDEDVIEIFGRLNSINKSLNLQEKRNARFGGEFKQFCLSEAANRLRIWRDLGVFSATDISRMVEVQFVSELVINMLEGLQDYSAKIIDGFYAQYDESFPQQKLISDRMERVFAMIASLDESAIRDTIFSRSPLFFSLVLILDSIQERVKPRVLEDHLYTIDRTFHSDLPVAERPATDAQFYIACTSNMHRIKSRRIRDSYIRSAIAG